MRRLLVAILFPIVSVGVAFVNGASARDLVSSVTLTAQTSAYSGPCPADIAFVATVIGEPGTVIGIKFSGSGFPPSKGTFGYITETGSVSIENSVSVDASHTGTFDRHVEITPYYGPVGGMSPTATISSKPVTYSVACVATPAPAATSGSAPTPLATAAINLSLDGVAVGDAPAPVLARLGLHPPGWAAHGAAPSGSIAAGEFRVFPTDNGNAIMMLLFDATIQLVMVQAVANKSSSIADPYGIHLNDSLNDLTKVRGSADKIEAKSVHDPTDIEYTYYYGRDDGIRWEYAIKDNRITSIGVVDCRIAGVCTPTKPRGSG